MPALVEGDLPPSRFTSRRRSACRWPAQGRLSIATPGDGRPTMGTSVVNVPSHGSAKDRRLKGRGFHIDQVVR